MTDKSAIKWTGATWDALDATKALQPLTRRKPTMYRVAHDIFNDAVSDQEIDRVFGVMALAPQHTFQVLTKRARRMRSYLSMARAHPVGVEAAVQTLNAHLVNPKSNVGSGCVLTGDIMHLRDWPLPNVWLGVSAEDQRRANERIPDLLATPAAVRFVSAEPLLGPIDFMKIDVRTWLDTLRPGRASDRHEFDPDMRWPLLRPFAHWQSGYSSPGLDWVIVGGESGPGARPMHPDWARAIRDQCAAAGVPFFFKQWGEWAPGEPVETMLVADAELTVGDGPICWAGRGGYAGAIPMIRVGKHHAGRLLDGREHNDMPEASK